MFGAKSKFYKNCFFLLVDIKVNWFLIVVTLATIWLFSKKTVTKLWEQYNIVMFCVEKKKNKKSKISAHLQHLKVHKEVLRICVYDGFRSSG